MATNNLLVNNEERVLREEQNKIERSAHNLSQSRKFPCEVGILYPFFCRKTLPSDSFKIWSNILIKQLQPLLVPQMVSFTVNTAFYWVDYSLAFPDFEYFLINQKGSHEIELPYVKLNSVVNSDSSPLLPEVVASNPSGFQSYHSLSEDLRSFLDISIHESNEKVDALPFWSYVTIKRDFYTNIDRLSDSEYLDFFPSDPLKWKLRAGLNYAIGDYVRVDSSSGYYLSGHYHNFDSLRAHDVRGDYFVNSYPTPLRGDVPILVADVEGVQSLSGKLNNVLSDFDIDFNHNTVLFNTGDDSNINGDVIFQRTGGSATDLEVRQDSTVKRLVSSSSGSPSSSYFFAHIQDLASRLKSFFGNTVTFSDLNSFSGNLSITTRQLRLLESLTRKREIDILMKPRLKNYLQTYFGVNRYKDDSLYQPVFIGSTTQQILINDIAQTTATSDSPLGRQGATAMSLGSGYVGEYYCRNYGCLMGIMYILPDYDYEPALPREWQERTPDEFVNPEFSHLSLSPILNKELFVSDDDSWNNEVLGYMGMYDNYRTSQNLVCGSFLNPDYQDIRQFAQVRRFDNTNKPEITTSFLNSHTAFDKTVFSVPSLPPFIAQCVARVEAVRPLPQVAIPRG